LRPQESKRPLQLSLDLHWRKLVALDHRCKVGEESSHWLEHQGRGAEEVAAPGDPFLGQEVDQYHRRRADLASAGLKRSVHRQVDRVNDKATDSKFGIEVHVFSPPFSGLKLSHLITL
jgi:hypothetical protein